MTTRDFTANVISATPVVPDGNFKDSKASGVWDINEALDLIKGGNWPNVANINPSAFVNALFQTHLYTGNNTSTAINHHIDLSGKGGMVWTKNRDDTQTSFIHDTERGATKLISPNDTNGEETQSSSLTSFNSNGFTVNNLYVNNNGDDYVSWTFRKQPKFFDVLTYTGDGNDGRTISHSLGSTPGMIIVARRDSTNYWRVWHRSQTGKYANLYATGAFASDSASNGVFNNYSGNSSTFTAGININASSATYVAYLFAHNNDDGGFGEPGDQDIIKCGTYAGNGNDARTIDLGFEAQWVLVKRSDGTTDWWILDNMRGLHARQISGKYLEANTSNAEASQGNFFADSQGFMVDAGDYNSSGENYIYMAIRRGGMQTPTAGTDVFDIDVTSSQPIDSGNPPPRNPFVVDMNIYKNRNEASTAFVTQARVIGPNYLQTSAADAEGSGYTTWDEMDGWGISNSSWESAANYVFYNWKRARGYFDVAPYLGTGSARTVGHNLGVVPEMMWVKCRSESQDWVIYHKDMDSSAPEDYGSPLNGTTGRTDSATFWNDTAPTSSVFTVGTDNEVNGSSKKYIAYLFASVEGVSKLGGYTGNGSSQTIDCGFQPRFIMIKKAINGNGGFLVFDTVRGIPAGNDPYLLIYSTDAENTGADTIDLTSTGFTVNDGNTNANTDGYIFYAIA